MWEACEALRDALLVLGPGIDGGKDSLSMAAKVRQWSTKCLFLFSPFYSSSPPLLLLFIRPSPPPILPSSFSSFLFSIPMHFIASSFLLLLTCFMLSSAPSSFVFLVLSFQHFSIQFLLLSFIWHSTFTSGRAGDREVTRPSDSDLLRLLSRHHTDSHSRLQARRGKRKDIWCNLIWCD